MKVGTPQLLSIRSPVLQEKYTYTQLIIIQVKVWLMLELKFTIIHMNYIYSFDSYVKFNILPSPKVLP